MVSLVACYSNSGGLVIGRGEVSLQGLLSAISGQRGQEQLSKRLKVGEQPSSKPLFGGKRKYSQFVTGAFFDKLARRRENEASSPTSQRSEEF